MEFSPIDARFESIGNGDSFRRDENHNCKLTEILRRLSQSLMQPQGPVASVVSIVHGFRAEGFNGRS